MADAIVEKICELERLNEEKQRFIDNLTHELKTPLTSIIGYANLLRTTKVNEKVLNQAVDYIYSEGKKLENLSGKMLDLIILKKDHFELKPTDLVPLVKDVTNSMQHKLEEKNIDVQILGKPVMVLSDRYLFQVLLSNLIDNAIKASPKDSTINVMVYLEDENTVVEVEDSGVGIPDAHLDKIMEPFYMVDKSRSGSRESSGLGLSICKKIADIHNAQIDFSSKVDRGTSVKIILP